MKKFISMLAVAIMVVGLTGCLDDPDGARERPSNSANVSIGL
jgi:predicted small lipoprotein YifL